MKFTTHHSNQDLIKFTFIYIFRQPLLIVFSMLYMFGIGYLFSKSDNYGYLVLHTLFIKEILEYFLTFYIVKTYDTNKKQQEKLKTINLKENFKSFYKNSFTIWIGFIIAFPLFLLIKMNLTLSNYFILSLYIIIIAGLNILFNQNNFLFSKYFFYKEVSFFVDKNAKEKIALLSKLFYDDNSKTLNIMLVVLFFPQFIMQSIMEKTFTILNDSYWLVIIVLFVNFMYLFYNIFKTIFFLDIMGLSLNKEEQKQENKNFVSKYQLDLT